MTNNQAMTIPVKTRRLLKSGRHARNQIEPVGFAAVKEQAWRARVHVKLRRQPGHGNREDTALVLFSRGRWTLATWWEANGHLEVGPVTLTAPTISEAWAAVAVRIAE